MPPTTALDPVETSSDAPLVLPHPAIVLKPILGGTSSETAATLHALFASHIATLLWSLSEQNRFGGDRRSIIVGIALKQSQQAQNEGGLSEEAKSTFKAVMRMIVDSQKSNVHA